MERNCCKCGNQIPPKRLQILPNTKTCVQCSSAERVACVTVVSGKTEYSEIQIVDQETAKKFNQLASRDSFGVMNGVKFKFDSRKN